MNAEDGKKAADTMYSPFKQFELSLALEMKIWKCHFRNSLFEFAF